MGKKVIIFESIHYMISNIQSGFDMLLCVLLELQK